MIPLIIAMICSDVETNFARSFVNFIENTKVNDKSLPESYYILNIRKFKNIPHLPNIFLVKDHFF